MRRSGVVFQAEVTLRGLRFGDGEEVLEGVRARVVPWSQVEYSTHNGSVNAVVRDELGVSVVVWPVPEGVKRTFRRALRRGLLKEMREGRYSVTVQHPSLRARVLAERWGSGLLAGALFAPIVYQLSRSIPWIDRLVGTGVMLPLGAPFLILWFVILRGKKWRNCSAALLDGRGVAAEMDDGRRMEKAWDDLVRVRRCGVYRMEFADGEWIGIEDKRARWFVEHQVERRGLRPPRPFRLWLLVAVFLVSQAGGLVLTLTVGHLWVMGRWTPYVSFGWVLPLTLVLPAVLNMGMNRMTERWARKKRRGEREKRRVRASH